MFFVDFLFLVAGIFTIYLGIVVTLRGDKLPVHRTFTFFAVNFGLWAVSLVLLNQTHDRIFEKSSLLFSLLGTASLPLFLYTFPRNRWPRWWFYFLYLPIFPVLILLPDNHIISDVQFPHDVIRPVAGEWFIIYPIIIAIYLLVALSLYLYRYYTITHAERIRAQYIGLGLATFILLGSVGAVLLPLLGNFDYFLTAPLSAFLVLITLATLAIIRHELIDIRIVITEVFVFLAAGVVLLNNFLYADQTIELVTAGFLLALFLFTAYRLVALVVSIVHQRQALKVANSKLKELMGMKTEFLQIASHQLRAPLTSLHGLVRMEAEGYFDELTPAKRDKFRKQMVESVDRLRQLVNDLLRALRLEGDQLPLAIDTVDVTALIQEAVSTLQANYDRKRLALTFVPEPSLPTISGDAEYLRQIFINLIDNAERYTTQGGVTIRAEHQDDNVVITVTDTGIGITPEERASLFEKFSRSDRAKQVRQEGTGLGLFIAKKITEAHHGTIDLISEGQNKGTTARVTLPISQKSAS